MYVIIDKGRFNPIDFTQLNYKSHQEQNVFVSINFHLIVIDELGHIAIEKKKKTIKIIICHKKMESENEFKGESIDLE